MMEATRRFLCQPYLQNSSPPLSVCPPKIGRLSLKNFSRAFPIPEQTKKRNSPKN